MTREAEIIGMQRKGSGPRNTDSLEKSKRQRRASGASGRKAATPAHFRLLPRASKSPLWVCGCGPAAGENDAKCARCLLLRLSPSSQAPAACCLLLSTSLLTLFQPELILLLGSLLCVPSAWKSLCSNVIESGSHHFCWSRPPCFPHFCRVFLYLELHLWTFQFLNLFFTVYYHYYFHYLFITFTHS